MKTAEVSIGLPVYNGARYLGAALDSTLEQSFGDVDIVICDNASTDAPAAIAAGYAVSDPRVRVFRNETHLGAVPNYDRTFELSRGRFFKWAAYDDTIEPRYLVANRRSPARGPRARPEATRATARSTKGAGSAAGIPPGSKSRTTKTSPGVSPRWCSF